MNGPNSKSRDRQEPKLTSFSSIDDASTKRTPALGGIDVERASAKTAGSVPPEKPRQKNGLLWTFCVFLAFIIFGLAGVGLVEIERLRGVQTTLTGQVQALNTTAAQIEGKVLASGGQLEQAQTSVISRLNGLERSVKQQRQALDSSTTRAQDQLNALGKSLPALEKELGTLAGQLKTAQDSASKQLSAQEKTLQSTLEKTKALESALNAQATLSDELKATTAVMKREGLALSQSLQILQEQTALPSGKLEKLQTQFGTYMQSVDQFRQQTNASLNELSSQIRTLQSAKTAQMQNNSSAMSTASGVVVQP